MSETFYWVAVIGGADCGHRHSSRYRASECAHASGGDGYRWRDGDGCGPDERLWPRHQCGKCQEADCPTCFPPPPERTALGHIEMLLRGEPLTEDMGPHARAVNLLLVEVRCWVSESMNKQLLAHLGTTLDGDGR